MTRSEIDRAVTAGVERGLTDQMISAEIGHGVSAEMVRRVRRRLALAPGSRRKPERPLGKGEVPVDGGSLDSGLSERPVSLDALLDAFQIDRRVWEIDRPTINTWEMGAKHPVTGETLSHPLYQTKATLRRRQDATDLLFRDILADIERAGARRKATPVPPVPRAMPHIEHMLEICLFDLHIGKLAWDEETGENYDSEIAVRGARRALNDLLGQLPRHVHIERITLPLGNDFFHVDNRQGTTESGTPVDRDSRYHKMFRIGRELASEMIALLAEIAPVDVVVVPGNHARISEWHLGEVLAAEFKHDPRVTVDNTPKPRKYVKYGVNLIGYAHGDGEPHDKLPNIMAIEARHLWADARFAEWHLAHIHKSKRQDAISVDSQNGVRMRTIGALSGTDGWHAARGYVGEPRCAEAFLWSKEHGLRGNYFAVVPPESSDAQRSAA